MLPRRILDGVTTHDGLQLELSQRGDEFLIQIDRDDLMSSRSHGSEEAMAQLVVEASEHPSGQHGKPVRWLVGGLGMGYTLRACLDALDHYADGSRVVVAEVFEPVVQWNREHLADLAGRPLDDARTEVVVGDVFDLLKPDGQTFDAILLDVDNGPEAMTLHSNDRLYRGRGLQWLREKLSPGGVLAIWSAFRAERFQNRLKKAGFSVEARQVRARPGKGERHTIILAKARSAGRPARKQYRR